MPTGRAAVVLVIALLLGACGSPGVDADHNPGELFPDRANQRREDQERRLGESAEIGGYTATVTATDVEPDGTVTITFDITNRDDESQRIDTTQWTLVNPRIQTLEVRAGDFPTHDLGAGSSVSAWVSFVIDPEETGVYYIQFKPEILDAAQGIWPLEVH